MTAEETLRRAEHNLDELRMNSYPGRGLALGFSEDGEHAVQVYWITGRSEGSRNRVLRDGRNGQVFTQQADQSKPVGNPELTLYNAMREEKGNYVVSNGRHTDIALAGLGTGMNLLESIVNFGYEPDSPNYTSRIIGAHRLDDGNRNSAEFAMVRKSPHSEKAEGFYCTRDIPAGYGHYISTYSGPGDPLPAFQGDPVLITLKGDATAIDIAFRAALNNENFVALAVKYIDLNTRKVEVLTHNKTVQQHTVRS